MSEHTAAEPLLILHVEDNPAHAELVRRSLETHRIANRLIQLNDGEAALEYLFKRKDGGQASDNPVPHVIILDLRLPGPDGLEICRAVRRERAYQPILMLTSKSAELDRVLGLETGADDYLTKPFSMLELAARVRAILVCSCAD